MAQFSNLQAPVTNQKASQRLADTQAIRARAAAGQAPANVNINQAAQQTGAALTQQAGQQAIQSQQQQAGLAKGQANLNLNQQKQDAQQRLFTQEQGLNDYTQKLDQSLFDINQEAANKEQQMRNEFAEGRSQTKFLQDQELLDWTLTNAKDTEDFKDKLQVIEQAHSRQAALLDHAFKIKQQAIRNEAKGASQERKQQLLTELQEISTAYARERQRRKAEANNRRSLKSAIGTGVGVGLAAAASFIPGGAMAAPLIIAGSQAVAQST